MTEEFKKLIAMLLAYKIPFVFQPPNQYGGGYVYGYKDEDTLFDRIWEYDDATVFEKITTFFDDPQCDDIGTDDVPADIAIGYILDREYTENGIDYNS